MGNSFSTKVPVEEVPTKIDPVVEEIETKQGSNKKKRRAHKDDNKDSKKKKIDTRRKTARDLQGESFVPLYPDEPRIPKKKVALLVGFNGTGYMGMQINPNAETIEGTVFKALCDAGAISKNNSDDIKKSNWMRCARTDKGVHAAGNVLSLKMQIIDGCDMVERINSHLPKQIRVWGYIPVINSFNPKNLCDSRIYEYLLPTYALMDPTKADLTDEKVREDDLMLCNNNREDPIIKYARRNTPEQIAERHAYRAPKERVEKLRNAMKVFEKSHNFHNYTIGKGFKDPSAKRFMIDITVSEPFAIDQSEWVSIKLQGQSFMLHQIRKMVAMAFMIARSDAPLSLIDETFKQDRINIPKAPALGLLLEKPLFGVYNNQIKKKSEKDRMEVNFDAHTEKIQKFKEEWIYKKIFETELKENIFDSFLTSLDSHIGNEYDYINPEGTIPEACIIHTKHNKQDL